MMLEDLIQTKEIQLERNKIIRQKKAIVNTFVVATVAVLVLVIAHTQRITTCIFQFLSEAKINTHRLSEYEQNSHKRHAIATFVSNSETELLDFCHVFKSFSMNEPGKGTTPILIFHDNNLPAHQKRDLSQCTDNPVLFYAMDISFPLGFDDESEFITHEHVAKQGLKKFNQRWGAVQMTRFWTSMIWKHSAVRNFETIMAVDSKSCFLDPGNMINADDVFSSGMPDNYVYQTDGIAMMESDKWINGLFDFAVRYLQKEGLTPANPDLWNYIRRAWENEKRLPVYQHNFEVSRVSFFTRNDVMKWHEALAESEPFGILRYKWSEANTRLLTMAMFADPDSVLLKRFPGYRHVKGLCNHEVGHNYNDINSVSYLRPNEGNRLDQQRVDHSIGNVH